MKGRTNVLGGGVILNASTAEKEIKSGNIVAGDFVEYYSEQAEIPFVSNVIYTGIIGSYIIARSPSNAIALIKNERIISTYSTYSISNSLIAGNYIVFFSGATIGVLKIQNDVLTLVDTYTCSGTLSGIWYANSRIIGLIGYQKLIVCTLGSNGAIQTHVESSISGLSSNSGPDIRYYDGWYYFICRSYNSYKCQLNNDDEATNMTQIYLWQYEKTFLYQKDSKVLYGQQTGSGTSRTTVLHWLELTTGSHITINGLKGTAVTPINENNNFISIGYIGPVCLYSFDDVAAELTLQAQTQDSFRYLNQTMNNTILYAPSQQIYTPRYSSDYQNMILDIEGNLISKPQDKNFVIPYRNGYNPIGVAKESGAAGDTIAVYIPTPSA